MINRLLLVGLFTTSAMMGCEDIMAQELRRVFTLEELFVSAEANNKSLKSKRAIVESMEYGEGIAKDSRLPEIESSLSLSYIGDGFTTARGLNDYQRAEIPHFGGGLTIGVEQPLYAGGAITSGIEMAKLNTLSARWALNLEEDNLRLRISGLYFELFKYDNLLRVSEENISQAEDMLAQMRAKFSEGMILENDITRYELLLSNLQLHRIEILNLMEILNNNLIKIAGLDAGTTVLPDTLLLDKVLPVESEMWWLNEGRNNSPAIKLAQNSVKLGNKAGDIVRSEKLPKIGLKAAWTIDGPILTEVPPINRNLSYWYVGLGVSYPISSLYKNTKKLARSKEQTLAAQAALENQFDELEMSVKADFVNYIQAYETLKTRIKGVELADKNYRITRARYQADMALITDLVDAANSKLDAEQQLINTRIDVIHYYYKLLFITGKI